MATETADATDSEALDTPIGQLRTRLRLNPDSPGLHLRLAKLLSEAGRTADAQSAVREMLHRFPHVREALLSQSVTDGTAPPRPVAKAAETHILPASHVAARATCMARATASAPARMPAGPSPAPRTAVLHAAAAGVYRQARPNLFDLPLASVVTELADQRAAGTATVEPASLAPGRRARAGWLLAHRSEAALCAGIVLAMLCGTFSATRHAGGILLDRRVWTELPAAGGGAPAPAAQTATIALPPATPAASLLPDVAAILAVIPSVSLPAAPATASPATLPATAFLNVSVVFPAHSPAARQEAGDLAQSLRLAGVAAAVHASEDPHALAYGVAYFYAEDSAAAEQLQNRLDRRFGPPRQVRQHGSHQQAPGALVVTVAGAAKQVPGGLAR